MFHKTKPPAGCGIILTCRDYSLDDIRSSFLEYAGLPHSVLNVPLLDDNELNQAIAEIPKLKRPNENPALHKLFLNPYILDKAARMDWLENANFPQDERSFRSKVWKEIIREDDKTASGMPMKREEVFLKIALRRAHSLDQYAKCGDLDKQILDHLRNSNLIEFSEKTDNLAAPAHDVLEDWALIRFLEQSFAIHSSDYSSFLKEFGTHPALRRAYRKWLGEMLECEPQAVDNYVLTVISDGNLTQQSRDDTLVSVMLSSDAAGFILRNEVMLLQENANLLRRMIHLLRVACRTLPNWLHSKDTSLALLVPQGPAWAATLRCIRQNLEIFNDNDLALLVGFLEDWSQGVNFWLSPYPEGAEDAATIAFELLKKTDDWSLGDFQKDLLKIIAKIPKASSDKFKELVQRAIDHGRGDETADELAKLLLEHLDGNAACRDFPELIIQLAEARWITKINNDSQEDLYSYSGLEIGSVFGLNDQLIFDFFPASAYHGPFIFLLRTHPDIGMPFIVRLLNHCVECYANSNETYSRVELPGSVTLELPDGSKAEQWCNDRLWCLYRGSSVGPYILQSALMALEKWLLECCQQNSTDVDSTLGLLLKNSNNVAITAVVSSISIAYPKLAGNIAISLLTCPAYFRLDLRRMAGDYHPSGDILADYLPKTSSEDDIYNNERKQANDLMHRRLNLETLIFNLQFSPYREQVWKMIDRYRQDLPPADRQTEEDRLWRISLHRMDLRQYKVDKEVKNGYVPLQLMPPEQDLQEYLAKDAPRLEAFGNQTSLLFWGMSVFKREKNSKPEEWRQRLLQAQSIFSELETIPDSFEKRMGEGGPAYTATVCVRDHWDELSEEDRIWCIEIILCSACRDANNQNEFVIGSKDSMDASRPTAFILSVLFGKGLTEEIERLLIEALALILTHASEEVVRYAVEGVGAFLWQADRELTLTCVAALVCNAKLKQKLCPHEGTRPYMERTERNNRAMEIASDVRSFIIRREPFNEQELFDLNLNERWGQAALQHLITIMDQQPQERLTKRFFGHIGEVLVGWWKENKRTRSHTRMNYDISHLNYFCIQRLARFVLNLDVNDASSLCKPLVDAVCTHPKEVGEFIQQLVYAEDKNGSGAVFWSLWQTFADKLFQEPLIEHIYEKDSNESKLLNALFLGIYWQEEIQHWQRLEGNAWRVDSLFEKLPPNSEILFFYSKYLYQIGEKSLPQAFVIISRKMKQGDPSVMLSNKNSTFCLESILRRYVYGNPSLLKSNNAVRDSVLHLLDELVDSGSSAAYRMRDDFVTPLSPTV